MSEKIKVIQVFLNGNGNSSAELSDELVSLKFKNNCAWVTFKEEDGNVGTTIFPLSSVMMIRLIDEEVE